MQRICRSLCTAGYSVQLIGRVHSSSIPLSTEPFQQTRLKCWFNKGKLFYAEYNLRLFFHLLAQKFDAVCAIDLDTIVPVYYAGKLKGAKLAYDAHELFTEVPEVVRRPAVQRVWQWVERRFLPKFNLVYTVSQGIVEIFHNKYGVQAGLIRNVPLSTSQEITPPSGEPIILYQGALNEGRGLEHLIPAMANIPARLLLAGEGDLSALLRQQVKNLGLQNKVQFLGYLPPQQLKAHTAKATIGVNLLENKGLSYYFSLSNKFFDYLQAGVPQLCINFPEYAAINKQCEVALLVENCSTGAIKSGLERLLFDHTFYAHLQQNCKQGRKQFCWEEEQLKLLAYYEQLFR